MKAASIAGTFVAARFQGLPLWAVARTSPSPCLLHTGSGYAPFIDSFLEQMRPGADAFITEKYAAELEVPLKSWRDSLCAPTRDLRTVQALLPVALDASSAGEGRL
jgi:hypothetical protein